MYVAHNDRSDDVEPVVSDHRVSAIDPATESVDWHVDVSGRPGQLSAGEETVYVNGGSSLLGIDAESGDTVVERDSYVPETIASTGETAYLATEDGTVAIESRTNASTTATACRGHPTVGGDELYVVCVEDDVLVLDRDILDIQRRVPLPDAVHGRRGPLAVDADGAYLTTRGGFLVALT